MTDFSSSPSTESVNAKTLNLLAEDYVASQHPFIIRALKCPLKAQYLTVIVLLIFTLFYVVLVNTGAEDYHATCGAEASENFLSKGIKVEPSTLEIIYLEHQLNTELTPSKIDEIKQTLKTKYEKQRLSIIASRKNVAEAAKTILSERQGLKFLPEISGQVDLYLSKTNQQSTAAEFPTLALYIALKDRIDNGKLPEFTAQSFTGESTGQQDFGRLWALLSQQYERENTFITSVEEYIKGMESYLSFSWLTTINWLIHLLFWTWFGVLINNIVWLSRIVKNRQESEDLEYSPYVYLTLFPRIVIAPFISVTFLAMVSAGIANFDITNLNNLPAFLVAAFFLGFMSESVTIRMRQLFNKLLDSISYQKQPTLSLAQIEPVASYSPMKNDSLAALETNMKQMAKATLEKNNIQNKLVENARLDKKTL